MEEALVALLEQFGLNRPDAPVFVQSFELENLVDLSTRLGLRARSVFLLEHSGAPWDCVARGEAARDYAWFTTAAGLREVVDAGVDGIGPELTMVVAAEPDGSTGADTGLVDRAHRAGLVVHPYTFRAENAFLYTDFRRGDDPSAHGDLAGQVRAFLDVGVDGFFTDHPDIGVRALRDWLAHARPGR
jgi:glycerophosphoryl diester phosphodiesterase